MAEHEPLESSFVTLSEPKRTWWWAQWSKRPSPKQPRQAVLCYVASATMRPSAPNETILFGYLHSEKGLYDGEPEALLQAIEDLDSEFFDTFPRKPETALDATFKKAAIGDAMRAFFRCGIPAHGKKNLRKEAVPQSGPLATI